MLACRRTPTRTPRRALGEPCRRPHSRGATRRPPISAGIARSARPSALSSRDKRAVRLVSSLAGRKLRAAARFLCDAARFFRPAARSLWPAARTLWPAARFFIHKSPGRRPAARTSGPAARSLCSAARLFRPAARSFIDEEHGSGAQGRSTRLRAPRKCRPARARRRRAAGPGTFFPRAQNRRPGRCSAATAGASLPRPAGVARGRRARYFGNQEVAGRPHG